MSISLKLEKVLKPIEETADALSNLVVYPIYNDTNLCLRRNDGVGTLRISQISVLSVLRTYRVTHKG